MLKENFSLLPVLAKRPISGILGFFPHWWALLSLHIYIAVIWLNVSGGMGGFQLEFVRISWVINHMTGYNLSALIG